MVLQKVNKKNMNKAGKQTPNQAKKSQPQEDSDISDFSEIDFDEPQTKKTPKGKQSLSGRKVSFQMPGKNTPVKTPAKQNTPAKTPAKQNTPAKTPAKQNTPRKAGLKEFAGMIFKQNKSFVEEDDEDEDSDLDFDADDLDLIDDDDEDDDEEELSNVNRSKNVQKNNLKSPKNQSPVKLEKQNQKTPKGAKTPKSLLSPKSIKKEKLQSVQIKEEKNYDDDDDSDEEEESSKSFQTLERNKIALDEMERRKQKDAASLFVGNLPQGMTTDEIKSLSKDIKFCSFPKRNMKSISFAFLLFDSEKKAQENYKLLKGVTLKGNKILVDFVGEKSLRKKQDIKDVKPLNYDLEKLLLLGLPVDCTIHQISNYFLKARSIAFNQSPAFRSATISFLDESEASEAFKRNKSVKVNGIEIPVLYATQEGSGKGGKRHKRKSPYKPNEKAKKQKV